MSESPTRGYAVELNEEDDGSWTAAIPDLPGAVAAGAGWADALAQIGDAIDAWVAAAEASGAGVPPPPPSAGRFSGRFVVRVPRSLHRAASLRAAREGVSLNTYCVAALTQAVTQGLGDEAAQEVRGREPAGRVVA